MFERISSSHGQLLFHFIFDCLDIVDSSTEVSRKDHDLVTDHAQATYIASTDAICSSIRPSHLNSHVSAESLPGHKYHPRRLFPVPIALRMPLR